VKEGRREGRRERGNEGRREGVVIFGSYGTL
jgi:hypothetical protein